LTEQKSFLGENIFCGRKNNFWENNYFLPGKVIFGRINIFGRKKSFLENIYFWPKKSFLEE